MQVADSYFYLFSILLYNISNSNILWLKYSKCTVRPIKIRLEATTCNNANATGCKELNCSVDGDFKFHPKSELLTFSVDKKSYPLFSEMEIAQISCKQRHTSVGYTSVAMVTRGSCFSVNSCSCHPIYPPLSLHFPSIWHQGQINKVDKQLKYCSSF